MSINILRNNIPLFLMLIIFVIDLLLILTTHHNWKNSMSKYIPLKSNIQALKSDLSIGHLWLEEAIAGDKYINLKIDVREKFAQKKFKKYIKEAKNVLNNENDVSFYSDLLLIKELAFDLEEISIQRWSNKADYKTGSDLDQIFDEIFNDTINLIDKLSNNIDERVKKEFKDRKQYFGIIITLFLFVNISSLAFIYKTKKENLEYEEELFQEKKRAEITLYSIGDAVITTNEKGKIHFLNPIAQKLTGYSLEEAIGKDFEKIFDIYDEKDEKKLESPVKRVIEEGIIVGLANGTLLKSKHGKIYIIEDSAAPIKDEEGKILGTVVVFHDVTEQTKLRKNLTEREKMLMQQSKLASMGEMLENIAHQWRQPLSAITTAASGIKLEKEYNILSDESFLKNVDVIIDSSNFLSRTIEDFRDFFKPRNEKIIFNLNTIILNSLNIMKPKFDYNNIDIIKDCENIEIKGFSTELLQILTIILNNSNDAFLDANIKNDKLVFIRTYKTKESVFVILKDNAGGVIEGNLHRIFEPYYTTKYKSLGRGLGLFTVQEIVTKYMNGRISAMNRNYEYKGKKYKGLEFIIELKND